MLEAVFIGYEVYEFANSCGLAKLAIRIKNTFMMER